MKRLLRIWTMIGFALFFSLTRANDKQTHDVFHLDHQKPMSGSLLLFHFAPDRLGPIAFISARLFANKNDIVCKLDLPFFMASFDGERYVPISHQWTNKPERMIAFYDDAFDERMHLAIDVDKVYSGIRAYLVKEKRTQWTGKVLICVGLSLSYASASEKMFDWQRYIYSDPILVKWTSEGGQVIGYNESSFTDGDSNRFYPIVSTGGSQPWTEKVPEKLSIEENEKGDATKEDHPAATPVSPGK